MDKKELKRKIENLETAWKYYHKDPRKNSMPNMLELTKLRCELERRERED